MNEKAQFIPFNAINEFMLTDFRRSVISETLSKLDEASEGKQRAIRELIRRTVKVQGFRNSAQAPLQMKVKGAISTFEKSPEFVKNVLQAWSEVNKDTCGQVHAFLTERNWKVLPVDADRSLLPGFLTRWPEAEQFEVLVKAYREKYPDSNATDNEISLMIVWIAGRLPVELVETEVFTEENGA